MSCSPNYQEITGQRELAVSQQVQSDIAELQNSRERWVGRNIKNYRFVLRADCCGPLRLIPLVSIEVREGKATSIAPVGGVRSPYLEGYERFNTIEKLFDVIEGAISRKAEFVSVSYEPASGYPMNIEVDESKSAVDDNFKLRVEHFEIIE